jgi:hypothetical protein
MSALKDLPIKCPNCKRVLFKTTDRYDPQKPPTGAMVKSLLRYHLDWLTISTTKGAEMTCPECLAPLVHKGQLSVQVPANRIPEVYRAMYPTDETGIPQDILDAAAGAEIEDGNLSIAIGDIEYGTGGIGLDAVVVDGVEKPTCPVCGKECKSQLGLNSHMRSHQGNKR